MYGAAYVKRIRSHRGWGPASAACTQCSTHFFYGGGHHVGGEVYAHHPAPPTHELGRQDSVSAADVENSLSSPVRGKAGVSGGRFADVPERGA